MNIKVQWKIVINSMIGVVVLFLVLIALLMAFGYSEPATIFCSALSAVGAIILGTVAVIQNKEAQETNKRLAKINQEQLETSIIKDNYPLIKFCKTQRIESDNKTLTLRFFDVRNAPLKESYTRNVGWLPFDSKYRASSEGRRLVLRKKEKKDTLRFTYPHSGSNEGIYTVSVPVDNLFRDYRFARIELEMDLISTTGVVTRNKAYVLLDKECDYKGMKERKYLTAYDQTFEIKEVMSEQKYRGEREESRDGSVARAC